MLVRYNAIPSAVMANHLFGFFNLNEGVALATISRAHAIAFKQHLEQTIAKPLVHAHGMNMFIPRLIPFNWGSPDVQEFIKIHGVYIKKGDENNVIRPSLRLIGAIPIHSKRAAEALNLTRTFDELLFLANQGNNFLVANAVTMMSRLFSEAKSTEDYAALTDFFKQPQGLLLMRSYCKARKMTPFHASKTTREGIPAELMLAVIQAIPDLLHFKAPGNDYCYRYLSRRNYGSEFTVRGVHYLVEGSLFCDLIKNKRFDVIKELMKIPGFHFNRAEVEDYFQSILRDTFRTRKQYDLTVADVDAFMDIGIGFAVDDPMQTKKNIRKCMQYGRLDVLKRVNERFPELTYQAVMDYLKDIVKDPAFDGDRNLHPILLLDKLKKLRASAAIKVGKVDPSLTPQEAALHRFYRHGHQLEVAFDFIQDIFKSKVTQRVEIAKARLFKVVDNQSEAKRTDASQTIAEVDALIAKLKKEIASCWYWNKDRKQQKIDFLNLINHAKQGDPTRTTAACIAEAEKKQNAL